MQIKGRTGFALPAQDYEIVPASEGDDGLTVKLSGVKSTLIESLQRRLIEPRAPENLVKKVGGGYIMDPKTKRPMRAIDENDPTFKADTLTHNILTMVATFYHGTLDDPDVTFESRQPEGERPDEWRKFYTDIRREMDEADLSLGAIGGAASSIMSLSGLDADKMREAASDFS